MSIDRIGSFEPLVGYPKLLLANRSRKLVAASVSLAAIVSGLTLSGGSPAAADPAGAPNNTGTGQTAASNSVSAGGGWEQGNDEDSDQERAEQERAEQKRAEENKAERKRVVQGSSTAKWFDAFGNQYKTEAQAVSADVVQSAQSSIANIDVTGGRETDYSVIGDQGVYVHNDIAVVLGSQGSDDIEVSYSGKSVTIGETTYELGGSGGVVMVGNGGNDRIVGSTADDWILGGSGHDTLYGGEGNDTIYGGGGADALRGGSGDDSLNGGEGRDNIYGGYGDDTIAGGDGNDYLEGGSGDDSLAGNDGRDLLSGGLGDDWLDGGLGNDFIVGGPGSDEIIDTKGDTDTVYVGEGDEVSSSSTDNLVEMSDGSHLGASIDLDGVIGTQDFREHALADITLLQSIPNGQKLLRALDATGKTVVIDHTNGSAYTSAKGEVSELYRDAEGNPGDGADSRILYNGEIPLPSDGTADQGFGGSSIVLGHELIHSLDFANGDMEPGESLDVDTNGVPLRNSSGEGFLTPNAELSAVGLPYGHGENLDDVSLGQPHDNVTEQDLRADLGLEPRRWYRDAPDDPYDETTQDLPITIHRPPEETESGQGSESDVDTEEIQRKLHISAPAGSGLDHGSDVGGTLPGAGASPELLSKQPVTQSASSDDSQQGVGTQYSDDSQRKIDPEPIDGKQERDNNQATATNDSTQDAQQVAEQSDRNASCVDSDGDGWGWTGSESCRMPGQ